MKDLVKIIGVGVAIGVVITLLKQVYLLLSGAELDWGMRLMRQLGYDILYAVPLCLVNSYVFDYIRDEQRVARFGNNRIFLVFIGLLPLLS